ncbi:MAG: hypothetical protein M1833_005143 [Piccolia ochrophora]|nr:MAG: hypothetical protein M1833_005143 [Piccolia ochrophora]
MALRPLEAGFELPASADFHVHLRDGAMMETVVPTIRSGGVNTVYVMPNLTPPITTVEHARAYHARLTALAPSVTFLMTLYLHPSLTPSTIAAAKASGIIHGVKAYPAGVTTNSAASGLTSFAPFHPIFAAMQDHDLVLNLHGEVPPSTTTGPAQDHPTILTAEEAFLPTLRSLHASFPRLRIVLEHATTAAALAAVRTCGPTVAATITAHHLHLTVDDWAADPFAYCKPVAKTPADRAALVRAVVAGEGRFFLGTDSAPHTVSAKRGGPGGRGRTAAGVFTQPWATQLVLDALEKAVESGIVGEGEVRTEVLEGFLGVYGRRFYRLKESGERIVVKKEQGEKVAEVVTGNEGVQIVPFRSGEETWTVQWKKGGS